VTSARNRGDVVVRPGDYWRVPAVAQDYDRCRFDNVRGRLYRRFEEAAIGQALGGLPEGRTVLDVACGTGRVTALLRRKGFRPTGCDISTAMLAVARRRLTSLGYDDVPLAAGDAQDLSYPAASFDAATCVGLLMHLDPEARVGTLRQLARVARDRVVVQYVCLDAFTRLRARVTGRPAGNVRYPISAAEMRADLERSGLTERARFWVLRGFSGSVVLLLTKRDFAPLAP
jgi:ubiquinone/menaquinone biosynthesis C-methylase UbiE